MQVTLAWSLSPRQVTEWTLDLPAGSTVGQALAHLPQHPESASLPPLPELLVAVWGRAATPVQVLRDRDRLELLRPLRVDPKVARRERFQKQGARAAGLFARRPGGRGPAR